MTRPAAHGALLLVVSVLVLPAWSPSDRSTARVVTSEGFALSIHLRSENGIRSNLAVSAATAIVSNATTGAFALASPEPMAAMLARCPTPAEIAFVSSAVRSLDFAGDLTAGALVCTASAGSADLTRLQARTYMTLLAMSRLRFSQPLPWTTSTLWDWFTSQVAGIRFRGDISESSSQGRVINIQTKIAMAAEDLYDDYRGAATMGLFVHEARHVAFGPHTCGVKDRTVAEQGASGVQYEFLQALATASDSAFIPVSDRARIAELATDILKNAFSPQCPRLDTAFLYREPGPPRRWYTGGYAKDRVVVEIRGLGDLSRCIARKVQFVNLSSTDAKAIEVLGQIKDSSCYGSIPWRLGDTPGDQLLTARLERDTADSVPIAAGRRNTVSFEAVAHAPATLVVGGAWTPGGLNGLSLATNQTGAFQPIVGVEFPIGLMLSNLTSSTGQGALIDNVRLLVATGARDFGTQIYVAAELAPLFEGPRAGALPLQISVGSILGLGSQGKPFFIALQFNGSAAISAAVAALK